MVGCFETVLSMRKVLESHLEDYGDIQYSIDNVGPALASFLFSDEAMKSIGLESPLFSGRSGSATLLFVFEPDAKKRKESACSRTDGNKVLADGFGLPVIWVKEKRHSPYLPQGLVEIAESVCKKTDNPNWGLWLNEPLENHDFSEIRVKASSAWTSLAAALELAVLDGKPQTDVFSTGCWEEGLGVGSVEGIKEKVAAVCRLTSRSLNSENGAKQTAEQETGETTEYRDEIADSAERGEEEGSETSSSYPVLFVPAGNYQEAKTAAQGRIKVVSYPPEQTRWKDALVEHLRTLDVPPNRATHTLYERLSYINREHIRTHLKTRQNYYIRHILHDLVEEKVKSSSRSVSGVSSEALRSGGVVAPGALQLNRLVLGLSFSYELAAFVLLMLKPARALLLVTPETLRYLGKIKEIVEGATVIEQQTVNQGGEETAFVECMNWLKKEPRQHLRGVDITGGTKLITAALLRAAIGAGARCFYVTHEYSDGKPVYGKELMEDVSWLARHGRKEDE